MTRTRGYKALNSNDTSTYQNFPWPIPKKTYNGRYFPNGKFPGRWLEIDKEPILCARGFHAWKSFSDAMENGSQVYLVELDGPIVEDDKKMAARRARLLRRVFPYNSY